MKKLLTILLILVLALALSSTALAEDGDEITDGGYVVMGPCFLTDLPATDEDAATAYGYFKAAADKGIKCTALKAGDTLDFGNSVKFKVLYPLTEVVDAVNSGKEKSDPNNESVVGRLTYKKFSMMLTGDAERKVESEIWADNDAKDLKCDVLKAGHHGSKTSSTDNFVKTVAPSYVLISCGPDEERRNTYGHPHLEALKNYLAEGVDKNHIYCTRWNGTITVVSDGKDFSVTPERKEDWLDKWMAHKKK